MSRSHHPRWTRPQDYGARQGHSKGGRPGPAGFLPLLVTLSLAVFTAVFLWGGPPAGFAFPAVPPASSNDDRESAGFGRCDGTAGGSCVVDGDTFWYEGEKIRIADINTPEVSQPQCPAEAEFGEQASERLTELLNEGPFTLEPADRDRDRYGRLLRVVTRGGESLGSVLEAEGLAEHWQGYRRNWC